MVLPTHLGDLRHERIGYEDHLFAVSDFGGCYHEAADVETQNGDRVVLADDALCGELGSIWFVAGVFHHQLELRAAQGLDTPSLVDVLDRYFSAYLALLTV